MIYIVSIIIIIAAFTILFRSEPRMCDNCNDTPKHMDDAGQYYCNKCKDKVMPFNEFMRRKCGLRFGDDFEITNMIFGTTELDIINKIPKSDPRWKEWELMTKLS